MQTGFLTLTLSMNLNFKVVSSIRTFQRLNTKRHILLFIKLYYNVSYVMFFPQILESFVTVSNYISFH